jgi:hypothetical protein
MIRKCCQVTTQITLGPGWPRISHDETFVGHVARLVRAAGSGVSRRSGRGNPARNTAECHRVAVSPGGRTERHVLTLARPEKRVRQPRKPFCLDRAHVFSLCSLQLASVQACARSVIGTGSGENSARLHGCRGRPRTESDRAGLRTCSGGRSRGILATQTILFGSSARFFSMLLFRDYTTRQSYAVPMVPFAPLTFSMMICCPSDAACLPQCWAS